MNKNDRENIMMLCKSIEKKKGKGSIYTLDSKNSKLDIGRWSTGIEDFDAILGGGMPKGRIIEIFGAESSAKTSLAYHLAAQHDIMLFEPAEGTFDAKRAKAFGNHKGQMIVNRPEYGEEALEQMILFAKQGIPLIVLDSIPFLVPKAEYDKAESDLEKDPRRGVVASLLTKTMPPLTRAIEKSGTTVLFINQVRDKMDAMMFGEKTQTMGGHAFKHACSVRIQIARRAWIEVPNKNPKNSAESEKVGMIAKIKVVKSKICNPYGEAELPMFFDCGFVSHEETVEKRKELMRLNNEKYLRKK